MKTQLVCKLLVASMIVMTVNSVGLTTASAAKKCTSSELAKYKKAKEQFVNDNSIIYLANKIKQIVEDARSRKSQLTGRYEDYTIKDLYTLQKQDNSIESAREHRDSWEPVLRQLSKKCKLPMPSRDELNPGTESD